MAFFLEIEELKSVMYRYQIQEITEADDDIVYTAISSATDEVKSYLRPNNKKEWQDGRLMYDVEQVFNATGENRNSLLLEITKNIAVWNIIRLCNVDMLFDNAKDRYDRAVAWLKQVNKGNITLDLPVLPPPSDNDPEGPQPFRFGSRTKFIHE